MKKFCGLATILLFVLVLASVPVSAQTGTITGSVTDSSHAGAGDVKVTARETQTNAVKSVQTNDSGNYRFPELVPGHYDVTFEKSGFKSIKFSEVVLTIGQSLTLDAGLEISAAASTVEVNASTAASVELDNASISSVIDEKRITDLPLVTRDPYQLVLLSPGVVQTNSNGGFSVHGQRDRNNNFLLDGADNNDTDVPGNASGLTTLNPDSTQEFRVITSNYLPEFGRNTGAVIDILTKSGTNQIHGSAYWFGRYNATAARDFFNPGIDQNGDAEPQDPFVRNIFGGSAGGRLIKDKTFWFANYEGSRFITTLTNTTAVPTDAFKSGVFTFNGTPVDLSDPNQNVTGQAFGQAEPLPFDPTIQSILALYPTANAGATAIDDVRGLYHFGSSSRTRGDNVTGKIDHNFSANERLSVRYTYNRSTDPNESHSDFLPGLDTVQLYARTQSLAINLDSTLSASLLNEVHLGANRTNLQFNCGGFSTFDNFSTSDPEGRGTDYSLPGLNTFGCGTLGDSDGQARFTGTYGMSDALTIIHGNHNIKVGASHNRVYSNSFDNFFSRPADSFNVFTTFQVPALNLIPGQPCNYGDQFGNAVQQQAFVADCGSNTLQNMVWMLSGVVDSQSQSQFFDKNADRSANDLRGFRQREVRVFFQDTWKIKPNLTLSYGLAWQYYGVPFEVNNNLANLFQDPSGAGPFTFTIVGPGEKQNLYNNYYRNYEPRIGIAWDPSKTGKTSIRAGFGTFHDRVFGNLVGNARGVPPFQQDYQSFVGDVLPNVGVPPTQVSSPTVSDGAFIDPVIFDQNFRTPATQAWNLGVQHQLSGNLTLEINYVGSHSDHLFRDVDGNPPQPGLVAANIADGADPSELTGNNLYIGGPGLQSVNNTAFLHTATQKSIANASYNGLEVKVSQRVWHGLSVQGAYTFSHAIDDSSDPIVPGFGNRSLPRNSFNLAAERGNSDFDARHHGNISYLYELPFGRGRSHLSNGILGRALEGWQISGITSISTGFPYDIFGSGNDNQHTGLSDRATVIGDTTLPSGHDKTQTGRNIDGFSEGTIDVASNLGRNHFYGPGFINFDAVLQKTTAITEHLKLVFRTESYNLFNHPNFNQPDNAIADTGVGGFGYSTSQSGQPDGTTGARQLQFALKLVF